MFINSFDYHPPTGGSQINKCLQPPMCSTFFPWPGNQAVLTGCKLKTAQSKFSIFLILICTSLIAYNQFSCPLQNIEVS